MFASDEIPVLGAMSALDAAMKLRELGEDELAARLEGAQLDLRGSKPARSSLWPFQDKPWQYTEHAFGYIKAGSSTEDQPLVSAASIRADKNLLNSQIKITLNRLHVANYPGGNEHHILFEFSARNQAQAVAEDAHYSVSLRAREGQSAALVGIPIFVGLNVGQEGVAFKCQTINVKNTEDERLIEFMDSHPFRTGLELMKTVQPALVPLSQMVGGLAKALLKRARNVKVQEFNLGLDFGNVPMSARMAEGAYVIVQIPDTLKEDWDWRDWIYRPVTGNIVSADDLTTRLPFNYLVLGISRLRKEE
ncbi:hypothetical protein [Archangium violaceum]|uniref:hypothetical protein n=1 Tax=Archangium violaceum TaxID=83451 RepID=UPI0036DCB617